MVSLGKVSTLPTGGLALVVRLSFAIAPFIHTVHAGRSIKFDAGTN